MDLLTNGLFTIAAISGCLALILILQTISEAIGWIGVIKILLNGFIGGGIVFILYHFVIKYW